MPIKLPKGFTRRKSSGNALEEVENPPQSSFRVFERPAAGNRKSFSDVNLLTRTLSEGNPLDSPTEEPDNIFAPSHKKLPRTQTEHSALNYTNSSSMRFSTSAIPPSSADGPVQGDHQSPHSRNLNDIPVPPLASALRAAGRTFSFGGRLSRSSAPTPPPQKPAPSKVDRTVSESTASTATPPRLLDSDFSLGKMEDDYFSNMLDDFGKPDAPASQDPRNSNNKSVDIYSASPPDRTSPAFRKEEKASRPAPINTDCVKEVEASPYSWDSRHSEEGLLNTFDFGQDSNSTSPPGGQKSPPSNGSMTPATTAHRSLERPKAGTERGLRRSVIYPAKRSSTPVEDEDAKLIMNSLYSTKGGAQFPSDHETSDAENESSLFENVQTNKQNRADRQKPVAIRVLQSPGGTAESHHEPSIADHARLAARYEQSLPKSTSPNKVMTPSQFEHYRQQQELRRSNSDASKSDDSAESDFDEEDETEKNREAERQRRKQEAHLSVYRQQMMKVTGQQSPAPSLRPEMDQSSSSTPNLTVPSSIPENRTASGKSSEGDDDEEIPLGILAAHGFPNRNRPPTRLMNASSNPNLRASYHQPYVTASGPGSVANDGELRGPLPAFARHLPRDPYYGAGLVNQTNRESLAFGGGGSVYGGGSPALPPGGLVGVIANEERARAMRRGSPNAQAMHELHGTGAFPGMQGHNAGSGIPRPYTMMSLNSPNAAPNHQQGISAAEQAQLQLSQQMADMMQMQMQWMQQMVHMQGGQASPQPQMPMPMPFPPGVAANMNMRPASMPSAASFHNVPVGPNGDQRTLSMLDPNAAPRLNGPSMPNLFMGGNRPGTPGGRGYAPSIAPSERSNAGMAPRYRPVSTMNMDQGPGSGQWNDENQKPTISVVSPPPFHTSKTPPMSTIRPVSSMDRPTPLGTPGHRGGSDEEDDDEGWADLMKKREQKKTGWKTKRDPSTLGDLMNVVH